MKRNECRCRSQTTLRRAPRTGTQQANNANTSPGRSAGSGNIGAPFRKRPVETPADIATGAVEPALGDADLVRALRRLSGEETVAARPQPAPRRREPLEQALAALRLVVL